jgi:hypothetical protein
MYEIISVKNESMASTIIYILDSIYDIKTIYMTPIFHSFFFIESTHAT